jgi:hypothetical protein
MIDEGLRLDRLFKKFDRAPFHGGYSHPNIRVPRDDDDRDGILDAGDPVLHFRAGRVGHSHVGENAAGFLRTEDIKEIGRTIMCTDIKPGRSEQLAQRVSDRAVIIKDMYQ